MVTIYGKRKWQVVAWNSLVQLQREVKEEYTEDKETRNTKNERRRRYISVGEVKILTHYLLATKGEDIRIV